MAKKTLTYDIILTRDEDSWMVTVPDVPGCVTCGDTVEEAEAMAKDALEGVLASMFDRNIPIPIPSSRVGHVTVEVPEMPANQPRSA